MAIATINPATGEVVKTFDALNAEELDNRIAIAAASNRATPSPRPDDAPVTIATRPSRSNIWKASGTSGCIGSR